MQNSDWIALASAVVAACALTVTVWQLLVQRRHNLLSVRPHLELVTDGTEKSHLRVWIKNSGLGPALLDKIAFRAPGGWHCIRTRDDALHFIALIGGPNVKKVPRYYIPDRYSAINPGGAIDLCHLELEDKVNESTASQVERLLSLEYRIEYRCMYGEKYLTHHTATNAA